MSIGLTDYPLTEACTTRQETIKTVPWKEVGEDSRKYQLRVALVPEEDGGFSALAIDLPGVASQGDSEPEALDNVREAFLGVLEEYGSDIPWLENGITCPDIPRNARIKTILVDA